MVLPSTPIKKMEICYIRQLPLLAEETAIIEIMALIFIGKQLNVMDTAPTSELMFSEFNSDYMYHAV